MTLCYCIARRRLARQQSRCRAEPAVQLQMLGRLSWSLGLLGATNSPSTRQQARREAKAASALSAIQNEASDTV